MLICIQNSLFLKGLLVAIVFGVPAGAIGALTIQNTLRRGFKAGLITGLGSTVADLCYACVGICGITYISDFLVNYQQIIKLLGGSLIILIGINILKKKEKSKENQLNSYAVSKDFAISFGIAIMNPATVISFIVAFALVKIPAKTTMIQNFEIICGILSGSTFWWIILSGSICLLKKRLSSSIIQKINQVLGVFVIIMGIVFLLM